MAKYQLHELRKRAARLAWLRRIVLPALKRFGPRDITIRHPWWPEARLKLHFFRHRGYWFNGRARERTAMEAYRQFVKPGDTVIEVGGHIGFVTLHLRKLVGKHGSVVVFEPGPNNLPYLRSNVAPFPNIHIVEAACGDRNGMVNFWVENLTGQNNSLMPSYAAYLQNKQRAFVPSKSEKIRVSMMTLDTFVKENSLVPSLVKIDVEHAEHLVLLGARDCLTKYRPALIMEVEDRAPVEEFLAQLGYKVFDKSRPEWICLPENFNVPRAVLGTSAAAASSASSAEPSDRRRRDRTRYAQ